MRAELRPDRGAAAESADFFRSRPFLDAEEVTHTLRIEAESAEVSIPLVVREIPGAGGLLDATSPYGYPGATVAGDGIPLDRERVDWSATGLVSVFVRERLGAEPALSAARRRSEVLVHDPARPRRLRARFAEQIRQNERRGYSVAVVRGPEAGAAEREAFHAAYTETMHRANADDRYFFTLEYLSRVLEFDRSWILSAGRTAGGVGAGAIAAESDGLLHYYLGGTSDESLADSPFKNVVDSMVRLSDELELPLNLGGGVAPGDGLEQFKRAFANATLPFHTHELVCDREAYAALGADRKGGDFFPAYRAPA